jgi:type II secretory pathway pseudopilin PulG
LRSARGFTYLGVLFLLALAGVSLLAVSIFASHAARLEREAELLFVGEQYRQAIRRYAAANAMLPERYPRELASLLKDPHAPDTRRYLRRLYRDPVSGSEDWGLVRAPGGWIVGVYSLARAKPIKQANFSPGQESFAGAKSYADWRFLADPSLAPGTGSTGQAAASAGQAAARDGAPGSAPLAVAALSPPAPRAFSICDNAMRGDRTACEAIRPQRSADVYASCVASAQVRAQFCAAKPNARQLPPLDLR